MNQRIQFGSISWFDQNAEEQGQLESTIIHH